MNIGVCGLACLEFYTFYNLETAAAGLLAPVVVLNFSILNEQRVEEVLFKLSWYTRGFGALSPPGRLSHHVAPYMEKAAADAEVSSLWLKRWA